MNKTIYLPDEEAETWEKARRFANDRLSPVVLKALKEYIMTKEAEVAEAAGFERIEVEFDDSDDSGLPKRKAFRGKWIFSPGNPLRRWRDLDETEGHAYAVAVTAKGGVVVYFWRLTADFHPDVGNFEGMSKHRFLVFPSFDQAILHVDVNDAVRQAIRERGVPVEELDI
jgi:hypothetical protein